MYHNNFDTSTPVCAFMAKLLIFSLIMLYNVFFLFV